MSLERFRTSTKYADRPAAADIAFCVAAFANGMTDDRIERALEDDYLPAIPVLQHELPTFGEPWQRREIGPCGRASVRSIPFSFFLWVLRTTSLFGSVFCNLVP